MIITTRELKTLRWAIREAAAWRGTLTGGPPETLEAFNESIRIAQATVAKLRRPPDLYVVLSPPSDGLPFNTEYVCPAAFGAEFAHGHINDVLDQNDDRDAGKWVVRPAWMRV